MRLLSIVLTLLFAPLCIAAPSNEPADPKPTQDILDAIRDLDSPRYKVRDAASRRLLEAGTRAVSPLLEATATGSPEVVERASTVLADLMFHSDDQTAATARHAPTQL